MPRFSETVMDHFLSPRNAGPMNSPDLIGVAGTPGRGRHMVLHLKIADDRIIQATFQCHGCGATIAAGSMLTEMITGERIDRCRSLTAGDVVEALDGLPSDKRHCAGFAVGVRCTRHSRTAVRRGVRRAREDTVALETQDRRDGVGGDESRP